MPSHAPGGSARAIGRGLGLALQLVVLVAVPLALLSIVVPLASLTLHARAMRVLVADRDRRAVQAAADSLRHQLEHRADMIRSVALYAATAGSPQAALTHYTFLQPEFGGGLALFGPDPAGHDTLLAATSQPKSWAGRPVGELIPQLGTGAEPIFSPAFRDPSTGELAVLVAARTDTGPVAVGAFYPAELAQDGLEILAGASPEVRLWIVDANRQVLNLVGAAGPEPSLSEHPGVTEALHGQAGDVFLPVAGSEHVVAYSPVAPVGWALLMEEPWEAVDNPLLRRTQAAPLLLIPVVLFALLVLLFGIRQIVQPLRRLAATAGELGLGRYAAIEAPVGGIAEIRHLQAELVHMARQVQAAQQSLRGYVSAVTRGQEDERRRLARELHDGPVQALIALDQRVQMVQLKLKAAAPEVTERLSELRQMTGALLEDVRRVIRALRPLYLEDLGLMPALEMLARDLQTTAGIQTSFRVQGTPARLAPEREIATYRFAQEALSNVARHSQAISVEVSAVFEPAVFTLRVQDNGRGFTLPERLGDVTQDSHFGLIGMQERAELAGGRLTLLSAPGRGTSVELRLPLPG